VLNEHQLFFLMAMIDCVGIRDVKIEFFG